MVSKETRERICKLPSRHGDVTWFGTNAYVHGTPRLFRSPSCTTPPMAMLASKDKCPQDTESRAPPPSLSVTGRNPLRSFSTKEGVSSSPAQSVVASPHHGPLHRHHKMLAAARLSLKLVLSRTKPKQALSTLTKCA